MVLSVLLLNRFCPDCGDEDDCGDGNGRVDEDAIGTSTGDGAGVRALGSGIPCFS